jgi:hypothetical protein
MSCPDRVVLALIALTALSSAACGVSPRAPAVACSADEQCGADGWCVDHACIGNSPPKVVLDVPEDLASGVLFTLDASGTTDPDAGDHVVSYDWTVDVVSAPCDAPKIESKLSKAVVRFGCPGTYAIHVAATDTKGGASAPLTREVTVAAAGSGVVSAGPDRSVEHTCSASPRSCQLQASVKLAGAVSSGSTGSLTYAWTVAPPPDRPLDGTRSVRFTPGANVLDPTVDISTNGSPISGDWVLHLEVREGTRLVGVDDLRLSVGDRPPVVTVEVAPSPFSHTFDAATSTYRAKGAIGLQITDPDGDEVTHRVEWRHTGDGGGLFGGVEAGDSITFDIAVTAPSWLIGDVRRSIAITADDGNGGVTTTEAAVVVGDQPPQFTAGTNARVGHRFDATTQTFSTLAPTRVGSWTDPDGDPLTGVPTTDDPGCSVALAPDRSLSATCAAPYTALDSLARFAGKRDFTVSASDPWTTGTGAASLTITNRAPVASSLSYSAAMICGGDSAVCCQSLYYSCEVIGTRYPGGTFSIPLGLSDPDGDPLQVSATEPSSSLTVTCPATGCVARMTIPAVTACSTPVPRTITTQVSDGLVMVNGAVSVATTCR